MHGSGSPGAGWILEEKLMNTVERILQGWTRGWSSKCCPYKNPPHTYFLYRDVISVLEGPSLPRVSYRQSWIRWEQMGSPEAPRPEASGWEGPPVRMAPSPPCSQVLKAHLLC